jgi:serine/threonine protein kinase
MCFCLGCDRDSLAADVFSLGVVMYVLIFHELPFSLTQLELPSAPSLKPLPPQYSKELGSVIERMLDFVFFDLFVVFSVSVSVFFFVFFGVSHCLSLWLLFRIL